MELTTEWLDEHRKQAAHCGGATIPCDDFVELLDLATRTKAFETLGLDRLREMCEQDQVILDGEELRLLIMLASQATKRDTIALSTFLHVGIHSYAYRVRHHNVDLKWTTKIFFLASRDIVKIRKS